MKLPIDQVLPELKSILASHNRAVLTAEPGAGKTTRVPLALLHEPWLEGKKIILLEPRRLAARAAARYMANALGEQVGETVGYRVRLDTRIGEKTRIEVVTEGILTRMLQADPALEEAGLILFDEFHERSLHADLGLALSLQSQLLLREKLRILIMSATMDTMQTAAMLQPAPIIHCAGRVFPVHTHYYSSVRPANETIEALVVKTVCRALSEEADGDLLVFLPGVGEIRRVQGLLHVQGLPETTVVFPLYGQLSLEEQERATAPDRQGRRKIVLSTSIAETSLTVHGVRIIIDSGCMRVPKFSPRTGLSHLETIPVSKASADQRRGRAGRTGPGVCYRLWSEQQHQQLKPFNTPEIEDADLSSMALELAAWGAQDPSELQWLTPPPAAAFKQGIELLQLLGAVDETGRINDHGRKLSLTGGHPRLAHMILRASELGLAHEAAWLAAILNERDFVRKLEGRTEADLQLRMEAAYSGVLQGYQVDSAAVERIRIEARQWLLTSPLGSNKKPALRADRTGVLLAFAYPDRIGKLKNTGKFLLRSGRGAYLGELQPMSKAAYIAVAELEDTEIESRILRAAVLAEADLNHCFASEYRQERAVQWDEQQQRVKAEECVRLGAIMIKQSPIFQPDKELIAKALITAISKLGLQLLAWSKPLIQLQQRMMFIHATDASWPAADDAALMETLEEWLLPYLYDCRNLNDLKRINLQSALEGLMSWEQQRELAHAAPTHIVVPSGSRIPIDYSDSRSPALAVRLQEVFGLQHTPMIGRNQQIPLTLHLLSPAQRPVQITRDLSSFWQHTYYEVKKDLKGRYPKHHWPDDPTEASPTNRIRPRN